MMSPNEKMDKVEMDSRRPRRVFAGVVLLRSRRRGKVDLGQVSSSRDRLACRARMPWRSVGGSQVGGMEVDVVVWSVAAAPAFARGDGRSAKTNAIWEDRHRLTHSQ